MESTKKHATSSQVTALMEYMQKHVDLDKSRGTERQNTGIERDVEGQWTELAIKLNSMGGAVKSVEKWKQTWQNLKFNTKKRALKQQQSPCDINIVLNSEAGDTSLNTTADSDYVPPKKKYGSFDEEIIRIEKDKLEFDKEYKIQKIEVLSRIAAALEELAKKQ